MRDKFLPIGTIVYLKGGKKKVMITSYLIFSKGEENGKKLYDYAGCPYPEGILDSNVAVAFNHSQIEKIVFEGHEDTDFVEFNKSLVETVKKTGVNAD